MKFHTINYNFFNRPSIVVPRTSVDEKFIREYEEREKALEAASITKKPIYITGQAPTPASGVSLENISVDTLTEAVIAVINSDFAMTIKEKKKFVALWDSFVKERAAKGMIVNIEDVAKTLTAEIKKNKDRVKVRAVVAAIDIGAGVVAITIATTNWLVFCWTFALIVGVFGLYNIITSIRSYHKAKGLAILADYLKKAKEGLAGRVTTAGEEEQTLAATGQTQPEPSASSTGGNLTVDTLTEAVIAVINSDFAMTIKEKKKFVALWDSFVKERAAKGMIVNIEDVAKTLTAEIKKNKDRVKVRAAIGAAGIGMMVIAIAIATTTTTYWFAFWMAFALIVGEIWTLNTVTSIRSYHKAKGLAILADYLKKAKEGLAGRVTTAGEEEQTLAATGQTQPEPSASSTGEKITTTTPRPSAEEHPLIQFISDYIVRLGLEKGPGAATLSITELENVYKTVDLLRENNIELFVPQRVKLTENMQKAIKDIGKRESGDYVTCRQYSDLQNLAKQLQSPPIGKRIVITDITDEKDQEAMGRLVAEYPESFRLTRLLNVTLPANYASMDNTKKTVYQAKIVTIAILARLFEKNKTPMVEMLLRYMIKGCLNVDEKGMNEYFDELGNPNDGQGLSREALIKRILFLIGKTIKVVEKIGEEIRLMKAIWTAA